MPLIPTEPGATAVATTASVPPEVRVFCDKQRISGYFEQAVALTHQFFAPVERLEAEMERDPETGDEWVVVRIAVRLSEEEAAEARKHFTAEWVATVPWPERHLICLSCHIL